MCPSNVLLFCHCGFFFPFFCGKKEEMVQNNPNASFTCNIGLVVVFVCVILDHMQNMLITSPLCYGNVNVP